MAKSSAKKTTLTASWPNRVSDHAITRYIERWHGGVISMVNGSQVTVSRASIRKELEAMLRTATFVEHDGDKTIWRAGKGMLLTVLADGEVRTVLPPGATKTNRRPKKGR